MFFAFILTIVGCDEPTDTDTDHDTDAAAAFTWAGDQPCGCLFNSDHELICCDGGTCVGPLPLLMVLPDPAPHDVIDPECPAD